MLKDRVHIVATFVLAAFVAACATAVAPAEQSAPSLSRDHRVIHAEEALPAPGAALPAFSFPRYRAPGAVSAAGLVGAPAVIALWSSHCPYQGPWVAAFDTLARSARARGVSVVVLSDDVPGASLDSALARTRLAEAATGIGVASGRLAEVFDRSTTSPARSTMRVEFVLPSFLLVDARGRVVRRAFGPVWGFGPALDSLLRAGPTE